MAVITVSCAAAAPAAPAAVTGNPLAAVWREQHVEFFYKGRVSRYSCDGLRDKMRAMLTDYVKQQVNGDEELIKKLVPKHAPLTRRMVIDNMHLLRPWI